MAAVSIPFHFSANPSKLWRRYNTALCSSPLVTKSLTCAVAYGTGDVIAQLAFGSKKASLRERARHVELARVARMAAYGMLWCGPAGHTFYKQLDRVFSKRVQGKVATIAGKVGVDQLLYSPVSTAVFFAWANLAAGTAAAIPGDLSAKLAPSVQAAWALWVPAMTVNMALVPPAARILFINAVAIVWTVVLSGMSAAQPEAAALLADGELSLADIMAGPASPVAARSRTARRSSGGKQCNAPERVPSLLNFALPDLAGALERCVSGACAPRSASMTLHDTDVGAAPGDHLFCDDHDTPWACDAAPGPVDLDAMCLP